jgi:threonine dehydrogenase-like Zn-dependent dehydrogenase
MMVGTAGRQSIDWSLVWWRELTIQGAVVYGEEPGLDGRRTFDVVAEWLRDPAYAVDDLVTHTYVLEDYADALATASAGPAAGAVKVAFQVHGD